MKLITRETDYAIRALCYLAKHKNDVVTVTDLERVLKIPQPFLRKILQRLNKGKLLKSYKGVGGGFKLLRPSSRIFVTDVIRVFQGQIKLTEHIFKKGACPHIKTCVLKKKLDVIEGRVVRDLELITITSLLKDASYQ